MIGLGEPREVRAGVVGGSYFEVMGLHPVLGRLLDTRDDGPNAAGAVVLTYRFWTTALKSDPSVLGKTVRLGARARQPSWACWSHRCRIRRKPKSSPTS